MTVKYGAGPSGYTCVNRQVTTPFGAPISTSAPRTVSMTSLYSASNRSHVIAVSNVSLTMPMATSASRA